MMQSRKSLWGFGRADTTCVRLLFSFMVLSSSLAYAECTVSKFPIPGRIIAGTGIDVGKDGNLWFAQTSNGAIGRVTPKGEYIGNHLIPDFLRPRNLTTGPDGNIWFDITPTAGTARFGRFTISGVITQFPAPPNTIGALGEHGLTLGPDGNIWFTEPDEPFGHTVGRMTAEGMITRFSLSSDSKPAGIASGPDGNMWIAAQSGNEIIRMKTDGVIEEKIPVPTPNGSPSGITAGPDGNIWFTEQKGKKIARVNLPKEQGFEPVPLSVSEFAVPSDATPYEIISGPDDHLWFSEENADNIGYVTTNGVVREIPIPDSRGAGITVGPDGNIWFTEPYGYEIGRINIKSCANTK